MIAGSAPVPAPTHWAIRRVVHGDLNRDGVAIDDGSNVIFWPLEGGDGVLRLHRWQFALKNQSLV